MAKKKTGGKKSGLILTFYSNRSTPRVHRAGTKPKKPKKNWGRKTGSRRASKAEAKKVRKGRWLRSNGKGRKFNNKRGVGPSKAASRKAVRTRRRRYGKKGRRRR